MGVFSDIQIALETRLSTVVGLPTIAWENVHEEPTEGTPYIRPTNIAGDSTLNTMTGQQMNVGIYQIDVFYPTSDGPGTLLSMLDTIYSHFKADNELVANTTKVIVRSIGRTRVDIQGSWAMASIEIVYNSYAT